MQSSLVEVSAINPHGRMSTASTVDRGFVVVRGYETASVTE
jgi:hypothetical protein